MNRSCCFKTGCNLELFIKTDILSFWSLPSLPSSSWIPPSNRAVTLVDTRWEFTAQVAFYSPSWWKILPDPRGPPIWANRRVSHQPAGPRVAEPSSPRTRLGHSHSVRLLRLYRQTAWWDCRGRSDAQFALPLATALPRPRPPPPAQPPPPTSPPSPRCRSWVWHQETGRWVGLLSGCRASRVCTGEF